MTSEIKFNVPLCTSTPFAKSRERQQFFPSSKYGWYRVLVYSSSEDSSSSMEEQLEELHNSFQCTRAPLKPYYLHEGGEPDDPSDVKANFTFYVRHLSYALALHNVRVPGAQKLRVRVNNRLPKVHINEQYKLRLREALRSRFDVEKRCLNLSCFHRDAQWEEEFCALAQDDCLQVVIAELKQFFPKLHTLLLNSNYLRDLAAFRGVELYQPQLQSISLLDNELNDLESLRVFGALPIEYLILQRNPLTFKLADLCEIFPTLRVLDGMPISRYIEPPASDQPNILKPEECLEPTVLPTQKTIYIVEPVAYADLKRFLQEYLNIFDDSRERMTLAGFYQANALVSLSTAKDVCAGWLEHYSVFDNNSISQRTRVFELEASSAAALAMFSCWPRTRHLYETITVDLLVRQPQCVCFTITGLFEEYIPLTTLPLYRYFMRTFVLMPMDNSLPPDFRITNEMIYLCAASREQLQQLQSNNLPRVHIFTTECATNITSS